MDFDGFRGEPAEAFQDLVRAFCPDEWFGVLVVSGDKLFNG